MANESDPLIGKTIIIGITKLDAAENVVEQIQMHGTIREASLEQIVIRLSSGEDYYLPPDYNSIEDAPPGEYRFRSTGEVVVNPDLMPTWTIHAAKEESSRRDN